ncbi:response regulator transcription factor [Oribacterium sp. WCC10]|uniref:response regulator transcription factor n=1 Tax=Oribacterium sp. WCC10 TaxID=1855343 RepID=UPI0008E58126|nr:response regulator transcription factor [Oribacterium sp. WCC10]SFG64174.1 DNA-binding response regulator, OmpR family, contains REC and winged-helix (wHTH) domain [Oribacterium sp. WCC10]
MKILLAEDTSDLNRVLTVALEHEGFQVDSCFDGEQALNNGLKNGYDGIVLDIMMPKIDGIQVLKSFRQKNIVTPVLLLTAKSDVDDRVLGLDAGADDYLTKPFAMKELLARVRAMTRRKKEYNCEQMVFGDISLDGETFELKAVNSIRLSVKEFELLQTLILNSEQFLNNEYLLANVWENDEDATAQTVGLYIEYLKSKLDSISSNVAIENDINGYKLRYNK